MSVVRSRGGGNPRSSRGFVHSTGSLFLSTRGSLFLKSDTLPGRPLYGALPGRLWGRGIGLACPDNRVTCVACSSPQTTAESAPFDPNDHVEMCSYSLAAGFTTPSVAKAAWERAPAEADKICRMRLTLMEGGLVLLNSSPETS